MNFQRGLDPKEAMNIGRAGILKEIGGKIFNEKEFKAWHKYQSAPSINVVILVNNKKGTYEIKQNFIRYDGLGKGPESELYSVLLKLQENFRKYGIDWLTMPIMQKVSARTIGLDLVSVQPMSAPSPSLLYLDYQYINTKISGTIGTIKKRK